MRGVRSTALIRLAIVGILACLASVVSAQDVTTTAVKFLAALPKHPTFRQIRGSAPKGVRFSTPRFIYAEDTGIYSELSGLVSGAVRFFPDRIKQRERDNALMNRMTVHPSGMFLLRPEDGAMSVLVKFGQKQDSDAVAVNRIRKIAVVLGKPLHKAQLKNDADGETGWCAIWKTRGGFVYYRQYQFHALDGLCLVDSDRFPLDRLAPNRRLDKVDRRQAHRL
jgi:hypothetical protein